MSVYNLVARFVLAVAFGHAVIPKIRDVGRFQRAMANYQLLPRRLAPLGARLVIIAECLAFVSLAIGVELAPGALVASALLVGFAVAMSINLLRGRKFDCGCAGSASKPIGWPIVVRDLVLGAGSVVLFARPTTIAALFAGWRATTTSMAASNAAVVVLLTVLLGMSAHLMLRTWQCVRLAERVQRLEPSPSRLLQLGSRNGKGNR